MKIKNEKFLNKKYSDFELNELAEEIKEYKALLRSIGFDETQETIEYQNLNKTKKNKKKQKKTKKSD